MGYLHIDNLYKAQEILLFKTCYALEKLHGTSANVQWKDGNVRFSSGGEKASRFAALFDVDELVIKFGERFLPTDSVTVYGEAYGGSCQKMSKTYGSELKFAAFEVQVGEVWLAVPQAAELVAHLGLEFVDWVEIEATVEAIDRERDKPSVQAVRNMIEEPKVREGVVLRPPIEVVMNNGRRVIAKHKREEFAERGTPKLDDLDPTKRQLMEDADKIALEWVTPMRLEHVLDQLVSQREDKVVAIQDTGKVISLMVEDVVREAVGEIVDNLAVRKAVGGRAAQLFKQRLQSVLVSKEDK